MNWRIHETGCRRILSAAVAALALYAVVAFFPTPARLLWDHGAGYQLAGAAEILAGRHPFVDFKDIYGPLTHYASAVAQRLGGGRVGGELVLGGAGLALGYALFFRLLVACAVPVRLALGATLLAILVQPEAWRYYLFLLPMLFFTAAWRYAEVPNGRRRAAMALTVAGAGLFRPDLGVFTFLSAVVVILTTAGEGRQGAGRVAAFAGWVLLGAAPWLVWLAAHGRLAGYLENSSLDAVRDALGRARAAPWPDFSAGPLSPQNAKAVLFRLPAAMAVLAAVGLIWRRAELRGVVRARLLGAATFVALTQAQGAHIVDWIHVRDTLPMRIFLLAWLAAGGTPGWGRTLLRGAAMILGAALVAGVAGTLRWAEFSPAAVVEKVRRYDVTPGELLAEVRRRGENSRAGLSEYLRDHSRPDEGIFAVVEAPELNYFADRRLAGGQLGILPGYFSSAADQRELIARIRRGPTAFVVINGLGVGEEYPGLTLDRFAPDFFAFLEREFVEVARVAECRVLAPRWVRPAARAPEPGGDFPP